MNVAIVSSSFPSHANDSASAAGLFVRDFAIALSEFVDHVHVVTQDKGSGHSGSTEVFELHRYRWSGRDKALSQLKLYKPQDLIGAVSLLGNAYSALLELHETVGLDHVMAMWAVPAGLTAKKLSDRKGVPYSVWCLGSDIWTYGRIPFFKSQVRKVLRSAEFRYADGFELADEARALSSVSVEFLPSSRKLPVDAHEPAQLDSSSPRFLFVGRYARVKGVDVLLNAFADFRNRENRGTLYLFGVGPCEQEIRELVSQLGLTDFVFVGGLANEETVVTYAKAVDAFVIPSRNESIPVILSDAMQLGKPVIVTDVGDMGDIVKESGAGLVVPKEDAGALSLAMSELASSKDDSGVRFKSGVTALATRFNIRESASKFVRDIRPVETGEISKTEPSVPKEAT